MQISFFVHKFCMALFRKKIKIANFMTFLYKSIVWLQNNLLLWARWQCRIYSSWSWPIYLWTQMFPMVLSPTFCRECLKRTLKCCLSLSFVVIWFYCYLWFRLLIASFVDDYIYILLVAAAWIPVIKRQVINSELDPNLSFIE